MKATRYCGCTFCLGSPKTERPTNQLQTISLEHNQPKSYTNPGPSTLNSQQSVGQVEEGNRKCQAPFQISEERSEPYGGIRMMSIELSGKIVSWPCTGRQVSRSGRLKLYTVGTCGQVRGLFLMGIPFWVAFWSLED